MTFLSRQNRTVPTQQSQNRAFGRGLYGQADQAKIEQKMTQQQSYKLQLQRQIEEKEMRKRKEQQKIKMEDEKFMRQIDEINRKENQRKLQQKQKQRKIEDSIQSPNNKKQNNPHIATESRNPKTSIGNLNINIRETDQSSMPTVPRINLEAKYEQMESRNNLYSTSAQRGRTRPYLFQQNQQANIYYQERIRRHKQQMNMKLEQLSYHINSTKDNIKVDEEIEKIKRRLRAKPAPLTNQLGAGESRVQLQYQNKFFSIPKKSNEVYKSGNAANNTKEKSRVLDYQSRSKFTSYKNDGQSRMKYRTQNDDMYNLPDQGQYQGGEDKWGVRPGRDNYLSNREALDYESEAILGKIDDFLNKLNK